LLNQDKIIKLYNTDSPPPLSISTMLVSHLFSNGRVQAVTTGIKTMPESKDVREDIDVSTKVLNELLFQGLATEAFEYTEL